MWAWGGNSSLGISETLSTELSVLKPTQVKNLVDITKISINIFHGLALKKDGTVWVWGSSNQYGQLGTGKVFDPMIPNSSFDSIELVPIQLSSISDAIDIGTENAFGVSSYALKRNGELLKWGAGSNKDGKTGDFLKIPTTACVIPGLKELHNSFGISFAPWLLDSDGTVWIGYSDGCIQF